MMKQNSFNQIVKLLIINKGRKPIIKIIKQGSTTLKQKHFIENEDILDANFSIIIKFIISKIIIRTNTMEHGYPFFNIKNETNKGINKTIPSNSW